MKYHDIAYLLKKEIKSLLKNNKMKWKRQDNETNKMKWNEKKNGLKEHNK